MAVPSHKIEAIATPGTSSSGRTASGYHVSEADKQLFAERGYVHLPGVMSEEDMQSEIDEVCKPCSLFPTALGHYFQACWLLQSRVCFEQNQWHLRGIIRWCHSQCGRGEVMMRCKVSGVS